MCFKFYIQKHINYLHTKTLSISGDDELIESALVVLIYIVGMVNFFCIFLYHIYANSFVTLNKIKLICYNKIIVFSTYKLC